MKKIITLFLILSMTIFNLVACGPEVILEESEPITETVIEEITILEEEIIEEESTEIDIPHLEETVIVDNDNFTFIIKNVEINKDWGTLDLNVYIQNKTDKKLTFTWYDVSINDYMIDPFWATEVVPNKKMNSTISFWHQQLDENNIEKIENIEFNLQIYYLNEETWAVDDYLDEVYTLHFN